MSTISISGCLENNSNSNDVAWKNIDDEISGYFFNGTLSTVLSLSKSIYYDGTDWTHGLIFNISDTVTNRTYHKIGSIQITNQGTVVSENVISFFHMASPFMFSVEDTNITQFVRIGERHEDDYASLKMTIDNQSFVYLEENTDYTDIVIDGLLPGESKTVQLYLKSYGENLSGKYFSYMNLSVGYSASTTGIFSPEFELLDIAGNELIFNLNFLLSINSSSTIGDLYISYPLDVKYPQNMISPNPSKKNCYYIDVRLPVEGNIEQYPLDKYRGIISLKPKNPTYSNLLNYSLDGYHGVVNTTLWNINIEAKNNDIIFNFERNHEKDIFFLLLNLNRLFISIGLIFILLIISQKIIIKYGVNLKNNNLIDSFFNITNRFYFIGLSLPWISLIFFGLNYILYYSPSINAYGNEIMINKIIFLFILMFLIIIFKPNKKDINQF